MDGAGSRRQAANCFVRPMTAADLPATDEIFRLAFGKEFGLADPASFRGDAGLVAPRFAMYPDGCLVAEVEGRVAGLSIASHWGAVGILGPVCVHPGSWGRGIARVLIAHTMDRIDGWGCKAAGLFTNPSSPRHLRLYQEFGFWPRELTVVMSRRCGGGGVLADGFSSLVQEPEHQGAVLAGAAQAADRAYPGMDLSAEVAGVLRMGLGDILYAFHDGQADFAICHFGPGSEGGSTTFYVKYAQVAPGEDATSRLDRLVRACLARAEQLGADRLELGVNTRQQVAYGVLLQAGFRGHMHGLRMHRPRGELLDGDDSHILNDWR